MMTIPGLRCGHLLHTPPKIWRIDTKNDGLTKMHPRLQNMEAFSVPTLPKHNIAPQKKPSQKKRIVFQPPFFQGRAVSFMESMLNFLGEFLGFAEDAWKKYKILSTWWFRGDLLW